MKTILYGETKEKLKAGVDKLANAVRITLGAKGKNVVLNRGFGQIMIINDGVTIAKEVELPDPVENTGATLAKFVAEKTNDEAGDGTTTSIVLLQAFLDEMTKAETKDPRKLREEIHEIVEEVIKKLDERKKEIGEKDIYRVALNSSLDPEIAKTIDGLVKKIGKDGVVSIEEGRETGVKTDIVNGLKLDEGLMTPYFINNREALKCDLENTSVLVTKKPIDSVQDLLPIMEDLVRKGENRIAIFCEEITDEVLGFLITNKLQGKFNPLVVKTRDMDDLEIVTGAQVITHENNLKIEQETLGRAKRIESAKYHTTIVATEDKDTKLNIQMKAEEAKKQIESAETPVEKDMLRKRVARLQGGVAVIKICGENDQQTREMKLKTEDALNSVKAAMEDGIVEGGGMALAKAGLKLSEKNDAEQIMLNVLISPFRQIMENAEATEEFVTSGLIELEKEMKGFNVVTRKWENLWESGIIDPAKVVKSALKNAIHMGTQILMAEAGIIYNDHEKEKKGKT
jgi:chaperonin GroEL